MSINHRLHIDPNDVLGVSRDATLQDLREAYRAKAKRYHPDTGGEEWAFRIIAQSYEILSTARIASRTADLDAESPVPPRPAPQAPSRPPHEPAARPFFSEPPPRSGGVRPRPDSHESVRAGVQETAIDPAQVVDVEKMTIRYEAEHVWLITDRGREDRLLSCSLNITWPDPDLGLPPSAVANAEVILADLNKVFDALCVESRAISTRSSVVDGRFSAWLSYPNDERALAAFAKLRELLHNAGLVVKQWSRDTVIPRQWR